MDIVLYYIRDNLVGTHYFIYAFILLIIMFSMIGYLFKQKYAKYEIKLATSQDGNKKEVPSDKQVTQVEEKKDVEPREEVTPAPLPNVLEDNKNTPKPLPNNPSSIVSPTPIQEPTTSVDESIPEI